jgi:ribosomal protein S12 methylthiotransferase
VQDLVQKGTREIVLIAQDLAAYSDGTSGIVELVEEILLLEGEFWLRLLYMHPDHFPERLPLLARADRRLLAYFDVPFQHASPEVLARMGRRGSVEEYLGLVGRIREDAPGAVIRSTFLCGFPGESDSDFEQLLAFQREARLDWVGAFAYSREEDTPAFAFPNQVRKATAAKRKAAVESAQIPITHERLERHVGSSHDVLIEEPVRGEALVLARGYMHAPEVDGLVVMHAAESQGRFEPGSVVRARITARNGFDLEALPSRDTEP